LNEIRQIKVAFVDDKIKSIYDKLLVGTSEERELHKFISRAISDLKLNPFIGIKIPAKLWPKGYSTKHNINSLYKYDLPNGWRLIYTVKGSQLEILSIIIEWFDHKGYERRFKY